MTIEVEDGTGKAAAVSYLSAADADAYHSARGNAAWTGSSTVKEQALIKATSYIEIKYGLVWDGYRKTSSQALSWPRSFVYYPDLRITEFYPDNAIPNEVKNACALLALKALTNDLIKDEEQRVISESVSGAVSTTYSEFSGQQTQYPEVFLLLSRFMKGQGGLRMVRV